MAVGTVPTAVAFLAGAGTKAREAHRPGSMGSQAPALTKGPEEQQGGDKEPHVPGRPGTKAASCTFPLPLYPVSVTSRWGGAGGGPALLPNRPGCPPHAPRPGLLVPGAQRSEVGEGSAQHRKPSPLLPGGEGASPTG
jgi:hypothetical protein